MPLPRVVVPRSFEALSDVLRKRILDGDLPPGTLLPGERDLVEQTGLSRSSVREALRRLEAEGLLLTRRGRHGGTTVQSGNTEAIGRLVDVFIQGRRIPFATLLQTRQAIEPMLARLAAANRSSEQLAAVDAATELLEQAFPDRRGDMSRLNVDWHLAVAAASGNDLLTAFMQAISTACVRAGALEDYGSDDICRGLLRAHRRIRDAIAAGDAAAAERRMVRHLNAYRADLGSLAPRHVAVS